MKMRVHPWRTKITFGQTLNSGASGDVAFDAGGTIANSGNISELNELFNEFRIHSITLRYVPRYRDYTGYIGLTAAYTPGDASTLETYSSMTNFIEDLESAPGFFGQMCTAQSITFKVNSPKFGLEDEGNDKNSYVAYAGYHESGLATAEFGKILITWDVTLF